MNNLSVDELLNKAFSLACFILGSRQDAVRTVEEAMARLNVTTAAQGKRLYYKSASSWMGGAKADRYRNKVLFSEVHLLQRLVYIASEPYEQREERDSVDGLSGEEAMLIHFIKHLVRITTRRNSFYVTLGLSRLLYNYSTAETMEVYNAVIQDPERVKDDYYYRSRKGVLMQELKKRFGDLLEVARGPRGEERFRASDNQAKFAELAAECLSFFTPWYTPCLVPAGVNPIMDGITSLSSRGQKEEDKVEVDRIHAVLHPSCHDRLIKALGFDAPAQRLEVPHFFLSSGSSGGEGTSSGGERERKNPTRLAPHELDEIKGHLDEQSGRRKKAFAGLMRILVDGNEHARLDLSRSSHARFALDDEAELLEVRATVNGDDLLLASHLFAHQAQESRQQKAKASIILEGGQKLTINVAPVNDKEGVLVDVAYSETRALRAASLYLRQLTAKSSASSGNRSWASARVPALVLGFALLMLSAFGIVQFLRSRDSSPPISETATVNQPGENPIVENPPPVKDETEIPKVASSPLEASAANDKDTPRKLTRRKPATATAAVKPENEGNENLPRERQPRLAARQKTQPNENAPIGPERIPTTEPKETRGPRSGTEKFATTILEVKKIYVELRGDATLSGNVREKLIAKLSAGGRFVAVESKDEADARMRVTVKGVAGEAGKFSLRAELINADGDIIWTSNRAGEKGSIEIVAEGVIEGLLDEVLKLEGRR